MTASSSYVLTTTNSCSPQLSHVYVSSDDSRSPRFWSRSAASRAVNIGTFVLKERDFSFSFCGSKNSPRTNARAFRGEHNEVGTPHGPFSFQLIKKKWR